MKVMGAKGCRHKMVLKSCAGVSVLCFSLAAGDAPSDGAANLTLQKRPQSSCLSRACIEKLFIEKLNRKIFA